MKRTVKHGYTVSTYPSNNGYEMEVIGKYGELIRSTYDFSLLSAMKSHNKFLADI